MSFSVDGVTLASGHTLFEQLATQSVILLDGSLGPLNSTQEEALYTFVKRGGGLICMGDAVEMYHEYTLLGELLGEIHGFCAPQCELIAQVAYPDHYITRRVDPSFAVSEAAFLLKSAPADALTLWSVNWRFATYTLAYVRPFANGCVFCTTLGSSPEAQNHPVFQQMLARAARYVTGFAQLEQPERPTRVAMIGYGAIGFEHGTAISNVPGLDYSLVCDRNEERLLTARQAFPGVRTSTDLQEVIGDPDIDCVIISTPPNTHATIALEMLRAGKHVVVEKPFCLTTREADELIALSQDVKRALTVYQCRRWDPDFLAIQQVLQQGTIGPLFHVETFIGGYNHPCDHWHSDEEISGGVFYDWGSHYLDWILQLIPDPVVSVRGVSHKRVWHDVTNADQSSVYLRFAGGQEAEFMHSDIAAIMKPKWYILGERGAIVGEWRQETVKTRRWSGDLIEQRLAPSEALPELRVSIRERDGRIHEQHLMLPAMPAYAFHRNLANHLHADEPLAVQPEESRRNISVMEAAKRSAEHGGEIISLNV